MSSIDAETSLPGRALWEVPLTAALATGPFRARWSARVRAHLWPFARFVVVGGGSTLLSAVIFFPLLWFMSSTAANTVAAVITTLLSNEANRSWVFRSDRSGLGPRLAAAFTVALSYLVTTGALIALHVTEPDAGAGLQLTVMLVASAVAGLARYGLLALRIFPSAPDAGSAGHGPGRPESTQSNALSIAASSAP